MKNTIEVLVHPFDCEDYEKDKNFVFAREKKLVSPGKRIILTSNPEKAKRILGDRPVTIITAEDYSAKPINGWKGYNDRLKDYREVIISGAELTLDENKNPLNGCVIHAYEETNHPNKKIDIKACYISNF